MTIREEPLVNLWLDLDSLYVGPASESVVVNLVIEMANISDDGIVFHLGHMLCHDDVLVSSRSDEHVHLLNHVVESYNSETFHACLQSADGVHFSNEHSRSAGFHSLGASLAYITVSSD